MPHGVTGNSGSESVGFDYKFAKNSGIKPEEKEDFRDKPPIFAFNHGARGTEHNFENGSSYA